MPQKLDKMSKDKLHIDQYFKQGLKDLEIAPPPDAWKNIEDHLDKKRRPGMFFIWSALAASLVLFVGIGVLLKNENLQTQRLVNPGKANVASHPGRSLETKNIASRRTEPDLGQPILTNNQVVKSGSISQSRTIPTGQAVPGTTTPVNQYNKPIPAPEQLTTAADTNKNQPMAGRTEPSGMLALNRQKDQPPFRSLGINLHGKTRQDLIIPPSYVQADRPFTETNPLLDETVETPVVQKDQKWSLTGQIAPLYSYRNTNQGQSNERGLVAYSGGIKVNYQANHRLSFQTGVYYAVMGQTEDNVPMTTFLNSSNYYAAQNSTGKTVLVSTRNSMGPITGANTAGSNYVVSNITGVGSLQDKNNYPTVASDQGTVVQKLNYIELPFLARYKIIQKKDNKDKQFGIHLLGGLGANFLVNNYVILKADGNTSRFGSTADLNKFNYSTTLGFGVDYEIFRKVDISVEPTYKYYLNSISVNKDVDFRPYSFGLFTGIIYKF